MRQSKKVIVGVSGGVDSAVAAFLLKRQGFDVEGATFRLWDLEDDSMLGDAKSVCDALQIPHHILDLRQRFRHDVIDNFAREYDRGATPNPCVVCNRTIKFGAFLESAREMGADYISTGHYAKILHDQELKRYRVQKSKYDKKDQSYVLYSLSQKQLGSALLPLGDYDKAHIRKIASENGLLSGEKPESQDICFIPNGDYALFLSRYLGKDDEPGNFIDENGKILGIHKGIRHYTIGQRKGLGLSFDKPMFVSKIDGDTNVITVAASNALMKSKVKATNINWVDFDKLTQPMRVCAKIRYGATPAPAVVTALDNSTAEIVFDAPQRAITVGQSIVFYNEDYLVGGGIIYSAD